MPLPNMPPCPDSLKSIQQYLLIANEHDARDIVVSYWCRLYALQQGLKLDKSSPEAKKLLFFLMDWLEAEKNKEKDNEAIAHDIPAQAHLENYALKLFLYADQQDRAAVFNKKVVKAFFTAGLIYSVLETFGELTEEVANNQKYAKWKATYINNCLKNGETPVPGPVGGTDESTEMGFFAPQNPEMPGPSNAGYPPSNPFPDTNPEIPTIPKAEPAPPAPTPSQPTPAASSEGDSSATHTILPNGNAVTVDMIIRAQKLCKFATNSLSYDDVPSAVKNLQKALSLLTTGQED